MELSDESMMDDHDELDEEQIKMANHMCLLNLRKNFENKKKHSFETDMVMKILEQRNHLPEISKFAMKVSLKDIQD